MPCPHTLKVPVSKTLQECYIRCIQPYFHATEHEVKVMDIRFDPICVKQASGFLVAKYMLSDYTADLAIELVPL